jgi:hypothetical protein
MQIVPMAPRLIEKNVASETSLHTWQDRIRITAAAVASFDGFLNAPSAGKRRPVSAISQYNMNSIE